MLMISLCVCFSSCVSPENEVAEAKNTVEYVVDGVTYEGDFYWDDLITQESFDYYVFNVKEGACDQPYLIENWIHKIHRYESNDYELSVTKENKDGNYYYLYHKDDNKDGLSLRQKSLFFFFNSAECSISDVIYMQ